MPIKIPAQTFSVHSVPYLPVNLSQVIADDKTFTRSETMRINQLYPNWLTQLMQLRPDERINRTNHTGLLSGSFP
jgi:hypothetical protein